MARVHEKLGSWVLSRELEDIGLEFTSHYNMYEDEIQNKEKFPQLAEKLEPIPEVVDHYVGADTLLPKGDQMAGGNIVAKGHDANGDVKGRAHANPTLDTRVYQVEFAGGKFT